MSEKKAEAPNNHQEYLKDLRAKLLVKLGLPENTRPERVSQMLELKAELEKLTKKPEN